jgi:hypothetical protein
MVHGVRPFPLVGECLSAFSEWADVVVCSAEPNESLRREWEEHGLASFTAAIGGQEQGTKAEQIAAAMAGKYRPERALMVGDALGDWSTARSNGIRFFPIDPGAEDASWAAFHTSVARQFRSGDWPAEEAAARLASFEARLPLEPSWMGGRPMNACRADRVSCSALGLIVRRVGSVDK